jgi:uncharacterized protein YkwD
MRVCVCRRQRLPPATRGPRRFFALMMTLTALIAIGPASTSAPAATAVTPIPELARMLIKQVNVKRRAQGLPSLAISARLTRAADAHAHVLAATGTFTHDWDNGRPFAAWIRSFYPAHGFRFWDAAENLLWASRPFGAREAVTDWLASPPHRRNLLGQQFRSTGIAVIRAQGAGGVFGDRDVQIAVVEFGVRSR